MTADGAEKFRTELKVLVNQFEKESDKHKHLYRKLRYLIFFLTGCSTVLASLTLKFKDAEPWLNIGILLASVSASIVTSIEGLRKPSELWVLERNTFHALNDLKREMDIQGDQALTVAGFDSYFERMQSILAHSTENWTRQLQPAKREGSWSAATPATGSADNAKQTNT